MTGDFQIKAEIAADGRFIRQPSLFRRRVTRDGSSGFVAEPGRYHLYVALACPWSHRAVIARRLKGLEEAVTISYLDPFRDERGWAFSGGGFDDADPPGTYVDRLNRFSFLSEAYVATDPGFDGRVTVPVLWDRVTRQIVNNESADIVRMFDDEFEAAGANEVRLCPPALRAGVDELSALIYDTVNNGVYRAGFAGSQAAYDEAVTELFETLDLLEKRLETNRFLFGDTPTEVDWRLFVTLVRFDSVYYSHFKCNRRRIVDYPNLWGYTRDLYQHRGIAGTVAMAQIKRHYYTTHDWLNPGRIIPAGPDLDFFAPVTERARLGARA